MTDKWVSRLRVPCTLSEGTGYPEDMNYGNLYTEIPENLPDELVEVMAEGRGDIKIERIVSRQHASPPDFWYDQETTEWVVLLKGSAEIKFAGEGQPRSLLPGDWLEIPAKKKHRVERTSETEDTIWLAVHFAK